MLKKRVIIAGALLLPCIIANAQNAVNVTVNASTTVRTVDERVFGVNSVMWDQGMSLNTPGNLTQTTQLVQQAGIRFIRLPGGSNSDTFRWYSGRTINTTTGLPDFKWVSGFESSSKLIQSVTPQAQAIVTVNYGSGSPEEAAAWVAYANFPANVSPSQDVTIGVATDPLNSNYDFKKAGDWANLRASSKLNDSSDLDPLRLGMTQPMSFKYWEIGNEVYGLSWEYDKHTPKNEPYTYATNAAAFITKMKAVDPSIKIGVVVVTGQDTYSNNTPHTVGGHNGWTPIVLDRLKQLGVTPDFLIYHRYEQTPLIFASSPSQAESDTGLLQKASTWANDATDLRNQITTYFGTGGNNIELLITENNSVYSNPGKQSTSLVNGLFMADSIGNVLQTEFNGFIWWALRNSPPTNMNLSSSLYGWRNYGDYGMLSSGDSSCTSNVITCNSTYYEKFPNYYTMKLLSFFARGNDSVVQATSNSNLLSVFATKRASDSSMSLLVINKDPNATANVQFNVSGFTPGSTANVYTYGKANDNAANPLIATGCPDITSSTISSVSSTFSASFAPYSINVLTFGRDESARMSTSAPVISTQPGNKTATAGATATFTSGATGCPSPTYQWQRIASGASTWTSLSDDSTYSGSTTGTLVVTTATGLTGDQFRLQTTNNTGVANIINSNAATLTVSSSASSSSSSSSSSSVAAGGGSGGGGGSFDLALLSLLFAVLLISGKATYPAERQSDFLR